MDYEWKLILGTGDTEKVCEQASFAHHGLPFVSCSGSQLFRGAD